MLSEGEHYYGHCVLEDWNGEIIYLKARGVDYIARLPGNERPLGEYEQFPQLAGTRDEQAEEPA